MLDDDDVRRLVCKRLKGRTQREVAAELGVSCSYLNDYLRFRREAGPTMLEALGLRRVARYVRPRWVRVERGVRRTADGNANADA